MLSNNILSAVTQTKLLAQQTQHVSKTHQRKQTRNKMEKNSASCPQHSKSENVTSMTLLDKETYRPTIMPKSLLFLKQIEGWHTKQIEQPIVAV